MGLEPQFTAEEAPLQELSAGDGQPIEVVAREDHRHDPGALLAHLDDPKPVVGGAPEGKTHSVHEHDAGGASPDHNPEQPGQRMPDERDAISKLVGEAERDRQVGVEVHRPPGLVAQPQRAARNEATPATTSRPNATVAMSTSG